MLALAACMAIAAVVAVWPGIASASTPEVTISPSPSGGYFTSGETVTVSVGPNSLFAPHVRLVIIECADPLGSAANLPTSFISCDGNTIQGDPVLVQADGSIKDANYQMYAIPNAELGEQSNWVPVCNRTMACVLFVGENQNDFSMPKVFSKPFYFTASAPTIGGGGTSGTPKSGAASPSSSPSAVVPEPGPSAAVTIPAATLAFTGAATDILWVAGLGFALFLFGVVLRRLIRGGV